MDIKIKKQKSTSLGLTVASSVWCRDSLGYHSCSLCSRKRRSQRTFYSRDNVAPRRRAAATAPKQRPVRELAKKGGEGNRQQQRVTFGIRAHTPRIPVSSASAARRLLLSSLLHRLHLTWIPGAPEHLRVRCQRPSRGEEGEMDGRACRRMPHGD